MKLTKNLNLPIYNDPERDMFDLTLWNGANESIDIAYEEIKDTSKELTESFESNSKKIVDTFNTTTNETLNKLETTTKEVVDAFDESVSKVEEIFEEIPKVNASSEVVDARCGETTLGNKIRSINSQLDESTQQIKLEKYKTNFGRKTIVTFIDDDGHQDVWTKLKPLSEAKGVPFTLAIPCGLIGTNPYLTLEQLKTLHNINGFEIASHTYNHVRLADIPVNDMIDEVRNSYFKLNEWGLNCKNMVYPYGSYNQIVIDECKKYYRSSAQVGRLSKTENQVPIVSHELSRQALGTYELTGETSLDFFKTLIDNAKADTNGRWIVFMTHCGMTDDVNMQKISDLIDYIKSSGIDVVNYNDGYTMYGNTMEVGQKTKSGYYYQTYDGEVYSDKGLNGNVVVRELNAYKNSDTLDKFLKGKITYCPINFGGGSGFPDNSAGTYVVDNSYGLDGWVTRMFYTYNSNKVYVSKFKSDGSVLAWEQLGNGTSSVIITPPNLYNGNTLPSALPMGKLIFCPIQYSQVASGGFPEQFAGMLIIDTTGNEVGYITEEYKIYSKNSTWIRRAKDTSTFNSWEKIITNLNTPITNIELIDVVVGTINANSTVVINVPTTQTLSASNYLLVQRFNQTGGQGLVLTPFTNTSNEMLLHVTNTQTSTLNVGTIKIKLSQIKSQ